MAKNQGQLQRRKSFYLDCLNVYILYVFTQNAMHHKNNDKRQVSCDIPPSVYTHLSDVSLSVRRKAAFFFSISCLLETARRL